MRETIEIGSSPHGEECAQVGTEGYGIRAHAECKAYIGQLKREYEKAHGRPLPESVSLHVKGNNHDFGTYYEVAVSFDDGDRDTVEAAYWLEGNNPEFWDDTARRELGLETEADRLAKEEVEEKLQAKRNKFLAEKSEGIEGRRVKIVFSEYYFDPGDHHWEHRDAIPGEDTHAHYSDLEADDDGPWLELGYMTSGDYTGSLVEESNRKSWIEDFDPEMKVTLTYTCAYGTEGLCVYIPHLTPDQVAALRGLANYPVLDESAWSNLEFERQQEDWESYGRSDLKYELEKRYDVDLTEVSEKDLDNLWWGNEDITDRMGDLFFSEGISTVFRISEALDDDLVTRHDCLQLTGCKDLIGEETDLI